MEQKIRAAVFDVDGTLYDYHSHSIPQSAIDAVQQLRQQGVRIVVASGRSSGLLGQQVIQSIQPDYYVLASWTGMDSPWSWSASPWSRPSGWPSWPGS